MLLKAALGLLGVLTGIGCSAADAPGQRVGRLGWTALHEATFQGDVEAALRLIQRGAKVNAATNARFTPLHCAAWCGSLPTVEALLSAGADPAARSETSATPAHVAAVAGHVEIVRRLLAYAGPHEGEVCGGLIHWAAASMRLAFARVAPRWELVVRNGGLPDFEEVTAHPRPTGPVVALLLERGVDVEARNQLGMTPLHLAACGWNASALRVLLDAGAQVDARAAEAPSFKPQVTGYAPLHAACLMGPHSLSVSVGTAEACSETIRLLLEAGADARACTKEGWTCLHLLSQRNGMAPAAKMLIEAGADVNAKGASGIAPLHVAAGVGQDPEMAALLLARGAEANAYDANGCTPLNWARLGGQTLAGEQVAEILRGAGGMESGPFGRSLPTPAVDALP